MQQNISPLPWRVDGSYESGFDIDCEDANGVWTIANVNSHENAAFIVKACNSHDQLVAALKSVTDVLDTFGNLPDGLMAPSAWSIYKAEEKIAAARAALAAAGAE